MNFNNQTIWITGASSGIGKALVMALDNQNCQLIISSRRLEDLEAVKNSCLNPQNIACLPFDLADYQEMAFVVETAQSFFGNIDILINNGGISQRSLIIETDIAVDKKLMEIDYLGTVALSKALLPYFIKQQSGQFVTVTSLMGKFSSPYRSGYCGAKHALHGFFDTLRLEHEKDGISVTLICPGFVNTAVAKNAQTGDGSQQNIQDSATENGLDVNDFAERMLKAVHKKKFEAYFGKKEVLGIYLKRYFPKFLHWYTLRSIVR
ncbi:SDR family oxidoreductase [Bizionia myxarmorum]|uniref:SDR family oxidoreductase n=1 Tax=Bizionia myxarmorum TaxID=291186 RepID=A0A5D0R485_9FLAO|nr:SDR family oxidoreductase [Bizionia myxarmorum]TYB76400.1 SDR family oxidoreductase [Bizionia myxarmorum]